MPNRSQSFEFRVFPTNDAYEMNPKDEFTVVEDKRDINAARRYAGTLAKRNNGPVDLAYAYEAGKPAQDWADRYVTTAAPSEYHASGVRFERLG